MKYLLRGLLFFQCFWVSFVYAEPSRVLRIGIVPGGSPQAIKEESVGFAAKLQDLMQVPVQIVISENYEAIGEAFKKKELDFAFLTPRTYVLAEKQTPLKVLLKRVWEGPFYYSAVIVRKDSKIKSLKDLKKKKIIFVDEYSASGYLYPLVMLKKAGVLKADLEIIFSKNHQSSIQMLADKKADVAAVFADDEKGLHGAWTKYPISGLQVRVLKVSEPIPNDPFCVRNEFFEKYPQETYKLMSELIDMNQDPNLQKKYSNILGSRALSPATSKQYDPVREMIGELER